MVKFLKKDSLHTGLYRIHIEDVKYSMIDFKWDIDLAILHVKTTDLGTDSLTYHEIDTLIKLIENQVDTLTEPILTDEEKVLRLIDYHEKFSQLPTANTEKCEKDLEQLAQAYKNWKLNDYSKPELG